MARRVPVAREIHWGYIFAQFGIFILLYAVARSITGQDFALLIAAVVYVAYSNFGRFVLAGQHRRGIVLVRKRQWQASVPHFRASYEFFDRHQWIDRYRWLFLLSASAASYREMALVNEAFALGQQGLLVESRHVYERALAEFPGSPLAEVALNLMKRAQE